MRSSAQRCLLISPFTYILPPSANANSFVFLTGIVTCILVSPKAPVSKNIALNEKRKGMKWHALYSIYKRETFHSSKYYQFIPFISKISAQFDILDLSFG